MEIGLDHFPVPEMMTAGVEAQTCKVIVLDGSIKLTIEIFPKDPRICGNA